MNKKEKQEKKIEAIEYIMYYDASLSEYPQYANDREVAMIAVKKSGYNIKYVSKELKNDKEIVLIATKTNSGTLCNISDELRGDPDVIKSILKNKPIAFQDLYKKDQSNIDYIVLAIESGYSAFLLEYLNLVLESNIDIYKVLDVIDKMGVWDTYEDMEIDFYFNIFQNQQIKEAYQHVSKGEGLLEYKKKNKHLLRDIFYQMTENLMLKDMDCNISTKKAVKF
jgi:hypothetical protein